MVPSEFIMLASFCGPKVAFIDGRGNVGKVHIRRIMLCRSLASILIALLVECVEVHSWEDALPGYPSCGMKMNASLIVVRLDLDLE